MKRFWDKVDIRGEDDCWPWLAFKDFKGYGSFSLGGKTARAHRVAYSLSHGPTLGRMHVLHRCDNPSCMNPNHLFLGTNTDNHADKEHKGRGNQPKGVDNTNAKLSDGKVLWIREMLTEGMTHKRISDYFGVARQQVSMVASGLSWSHVK